MLLIVLKKTSTGSDGEKIEFIGENASKEEADPKEDENTPFTIEIQVKSNAEFIKKIEEIFKMWCPTYFDNPRSKLTHFK